MKREPMSFAHTYAEQGLSVLPCNGKKPYHRWKQYQSRRPSMGTLERWRQSHPNFNIGAVTGAISNIAVIDCDDPIMPVSGLCKIYGETPLIVKTPSGGKHLYYRYNGEKNGKLEGVQGEIRAEGGFIVLPPSRSIDTGTAYNFLEGSEIDFNSLPTMNHSASEQYQPVKDHANIDRLRVTGERNNSLFRFARVMALSLGEEQLFAAAHDYNHTQFITPLPALEVNNTVKQVIKYKREGKLMVSGRQYTCLPRWVSDLFEDNKTALYTFVKLRLLNPDQTKPFYAATSGLSQITNASVTTTRKHLRVLEQKGLIIRIAKGGRFEGDSARFKWGQLLMT